MLDSSPLPAPPPKKLKRTASVASLPSPPPSVEHLKKRTTAQRFTSNDSDTASGSDDEVEEAVNGNKIVGRKLLFPTGPSATSVTDDPDDPFLDHPKPSNARDLLANDADRSPSPHRRAAAPVSPPPSRRRTKTSTVPPRTPPPIDRRKGCVSLELPVTDEENNPFLTDSPPKPYRTRSPRDFAEPPTMTYVFKGVKTSFPNPNYNLPDSAYERSRLPLSHPDYSPPPTRTPKRLFPEAYPSVDDDAEKDGDSDGELDGTDTDLQTPDTKPRMSKLFVDDAGNPIPDSGPQGVRGKTMDAREIGRMAVGPIRGGGG